jgi:Pyruvate/2-oxoacid:ferredoxin oxidoreductase delta subunit
MAVREIIRIDEDKCDGCGDCVVSCAEGAIQIIDGKARLIKDQYCDGIGACIGDCPQDALTIEHREASDYNEAAVMEHLAEGAPALKVPMPNLSGCPGSAMRTLAPAAALSGASGADIPSQLAQWPIQLMLVPPDAPFLQGADLVICADCVPFAVPDFHTRYLTGRAVLVGCPKLDDLQFYHQKLAAIFREARPRRITVLRMEVPCCGGIAQASIQARNETSPQTPLVVHTIGIQGGIAEEAAPLD